MTNPTGTTCVICGKRPAERGYVCDTSRNRLHAQLRTIDELYALLPAALLPEQGDGPKVSGSREAPLPFRVDVFDLTLPANHAEVRDWWRDQTGRISVATVLDSWVRDWIEVRNEREHQPTPTVPVLVAWLQVRLHWACDEHPAVDDFAKEIADLAGALRSATGQTGDHKVIGPCPVVLESGPCLATLKASPWIDIIECPKCSTRWDRLKWFILGAAIQQRKAEMSHVSETIA